MTVVVKVENVSKKYQLGTIGTQSLRGDMQRWWSKVRGKENPFAKLGEKSQKQGRDFWALKDIDFEIRQGEAVGIIGKNGAGKSTLLKILSRITTPTTGSVKIKGRIASLLEVGTGFNPELTGRENIFLNGAILGMRKQEVTAKFDEIVDFSGVEKFIDTPVKRYSSGMYVRLAFAVAAHLESEILILDEVLAVGDTEFQEKCLGKMDDVAHKQGKTILFVSHGMSSVSSLCNKAMFLNNGILQMIGEPSAVISKYLEKENKQVLHYFERPSINQQTPIIKRAWLEDDHGSQIDKYYNGDSIILKVEVENKNNLPTELSIAFFDGTQIPLWNYTHGMHGFSTIPNERNVVCRFIFYPPKLTVEELIIHLATGPKGGVPYYDHVIDAIKIPVLEKKNNPLLLKYKQWPILCDVDVDYNIIDSKVTL